MLHQLVTVGYQILIQGHVAVINPSPANHSNRQSDRFPRTSGPIEYETCGNRQIIKYELIINAPVAVPVKLDWWSSICWIEWLSHSSRRDQKEEGGGAKGGEGGTKSLLTYLTVVYLQFDWNNISLWFVDVGTWNPRCKQSQKKTLPSLSPPPLSLSL